jgi:hypothetical protein
MDVVGESYRERIDVEILKSIQVFSSPEYENCFLESNVFVYECEYVCLYVYA